MIAATHDGSFHADEVFALAALRLIHPDLEIVRTRDREKLAEADLRIDVGFRYDPAAGDLDHHQREFSEERENGIGYASFGLVWRKYGPQACGGDAAVAAAVDDSLVAAVDANDTGQRLFAPAIEGARQMTVNSVVGGYNARWDEDLSPEEERERFEQAVEFARGVIEREIASAAAGSRAARIVEAAIAEAADPRLVELSENVPWKQVLVPAAPEALFVIYPKRQGFGLETVPVELGTFENRRDLPAEWAGLDSEDLSELTGVEDALFCHGKRFLAVARSREGIGRLAAMALAGS